jgi:hypothetical protein
LWLGYYRRAGEFEQTRTGYEYTLQIPFGQLVPSLQLASRGFVGGSVNAQIGGDAIYALLGFGRTNMRDYYNLNFDPNDSIVFGIGTRLLPKTALSLFTVKDDRLQTGQTVTHLVWRRVPDERQRWTVDLSAKHGRATPDDAPVSGAALSVTYDYGDVFVRLAREMASVILASFLAGCLRAPGAGSESQFQRRRSNARIAGAAILVQACRPHYRIH